MAVAPTRWWATTIAAGTVTLGVAQDGTTSGPLGTAGTISLPGGTLRYTAANTHDYSARFSTAANQQYRVDTNGQDVIWASPLTSSGGRLIKTGTGTLTINATNTASGNVEIAGGTVVVPAGRTLAFSGATKSNNDAVVISGGATLELNGWGGWGATGPLGQLNYNTGYLQVNGGTIRMASTASANRGVVLGVNGTTLESAAGVTWTIDSGGSSFTGSGRRQRRDDPDLGHRANRIRPGSDRAVWGHTVGGRGRGGLVPQYDRRLRHQLVILRQSLRHARR